MYSTYPILLVHPYPWPMRTVAETGLARTALAAAALQRSLCRRRRPTPSGRSPTRGSSSMRRVCLLADEENFLGRRTRLQSKALDGLLHRLERQVGGRGPSSSVGALGIVLFIIFCQTGEGGVLLQQTEPGQLAFTHHLCPAPVYIVSQPAVPPSGGSDVSIRSSIVADGRCHVAVELFVGDHLLDRAYLQRGDGGRSTSRHDGSGEFLSAGDKLGAFLRRSPGERSTLKSPECGRSGPERPIIQSH